METDYYRKVIKKYRKENKLSQEKLAELLGYDTTYMSHIETGKREPSVDFFYKVFKLIRHIFWLFVLLWNTDWYSNKIKWTF